MGVVKKGGILAWLPLCMLMDATSSGLIVVALGGTLKGEFLVNVCALLSWSPSDDVCCSLFALVGWSR